MLSVCILKNRIKLIERDVLMIRRVMKMRNAIECCRDLKFELNFDDVVNIHTH